MNSSAMLGSLECADHDAAGLIEDLASGEYDDSGCYDFGMAIYIILDHFCVAWHRGNMSDDDVRSPIDQNAFERMCLSVPNWGRIFRLVDVDELKECGRARYVSPRLNRNAVIEHFQLMRKEINKLCDDICAGRIDELEPVEASSHFIPIIVEFCLAWHFKWLSDRDIEVLSAERLDILKTSIPSVGVEPRILVDVRCVIGRP